MERWIERILTWLFPKPDLESEWTIVRMRRLLDHDLDYSQRSLRWRKQ